VTGTLIAPVIPSSDRGPYRPRACRCPDPAARGPARTEPPAGPTAKFPGATQIVDLCHARGHLHSLTRSLELMLGDRRDEWLAARLEDLDYGDINGIEAAVREYPLEGIKKDEVGKELGCFLNNAPRMRYRWFRSRGLFAGSGVVEASCKTIVGQRLKQAGMHWTVAGADAIIALRCKEASSQREAICNHRHNQTGAA
jgi:hypothetical protein